MRKQLHKGHDIRDDRQEKNQEFQQRGATSIELSMYITVPVWQLLM